MLVSHFMCPRANIITCNEWDSILSVAESIVERKFSAIVVIGKTGQPSGIVTKTDLAVAYAQNIPVHQKVRRFADCLAVEKVDLLVKKGGMLSVERPISTEIINPVARMNRQ
jgi:signal-transduction protein with cAMP-binding, CBS, and nucleotidyltransferase domain